LYKKKEVPKVPHQQLAGKSMIKKEDFSLMTNLRNKKPLQV